MKSFRFALLSVALLTVGCGDDEPDTSITEDSATVADSAAADSTTDSTVDSEPADTAVEETAPSESGTDTTPADTATTDSLMLDSTVADTVVVDTAVADTTVADTTVADVADSTAADTVADSAADTLVDTAVADTADAPSACGAGDGAVCNAIVMPAAAGLVTTEIGALPAVAGGGPIPDGMYKLIREIKSSGSVNTQRHVFQQFGTCYENLTQNSSGAEGTRARATVSYVGENVTLTLLCPMIPLPPFSGKYKTEVLGSGKTKMYTFDGDKLYREWEQL